MFLGSLVFRPWSPSLLGRVLHADGEDHRLEPGELQLALGRLGGRLVFLLPGNPVSCLCAYDFFAGRAIRLLGARRWEWPYRSCRRTLRRKLVSTVGRVDYARVKIVDDQIEPLAISGASVLSSTTRADGFVVVPEDSEGYAEGSEVELFLYDP